jgi:hypothetical protein
MPNHIRGNNIGVIVGNNKNGSIQYTVPHKRSDPKQNYNAHKPWMTFVFVEALKFS